MTSQPRPRACLKDIPVYIPGRDGAGFSGQVHKLSSNESPLGASPVAQKAYREAAATLHRYPDGAAHDLRQRLGRKHDLDPDRIICGSGSDEILQLLARAYLGDGDQAIYTAHGFLLYPSLIKASGSLPVVAPEVDYTVNVDHILQKLCAATRMVFLANPGNPTGTYLGRDEIARLHAGLPPSCLLVLDGAYAEYVERPDYDCGLSLATTTRNVFVTRTFSKAYGMAGLRLGWGYGCPDIVGALQKLRGPFNVSTAALTAGVAAVEDEDHLAKSVAHNARWRPWLEGVLTGLGLKVTPGVGNFLLAHFPPEPEKNAAAAEAFLRRHGIFVRDMAPYNLGHALRISVGSKDANLALRDCLHEFLA